MPIKRYRNVKWDKRRQFKKSLEKFNLSEEAFKLIDIISHQNIIVTTFNSLLREANLDYKKHASESSLIKLYTALAIIDYIDMKDKKNILTEIKKAIKKLVDKKNYKDRGLEETDFEELISSKYKLSEEEIKEYFSNNEYYTKVAEVFSNPFDDQKYFDFAYLFTFYVSIETSFNKYNVSDDINIFLIKLDVQQQMIDVLSHISPKNFNSVIINTNKWFKKFDKKFNRLLTKKEVD